MGERKLIEFIHRPVLLNQCIEGLQIKPSGLYIDGTLGGGGHAEAIAQRLDSDGLLIGIDRDGDAIAAGEKRLKALGKPFILIRDNYENIQQVLKDRSIQAVDGFLLDLGVSSHQLDTPSRGFSYRYDAPLDMRMDDRAGLTAHDVVNGYSEKELAGVIKDYGEERYAKSIARVLCRERPVETTFQLAQIITDTIPGRPPSQGHPAARTFQAIRIVVNGELTRLSQTITEMVHFLKPGGRICIITFHSLEDRIVKQAFKYWANPCQCPRDIPYCVCEKTPVLTVVTKKPIKSSLKELVDNPRAHSAKLRIAERLGV